MKIRSAVLAAIFTFGGSAAQAELIVTSNDGHSQNPGLARAERSADSVSVIDFTNSSVKLLGSVLAPASIIGPPVSVAVSRDHKFALVTGNTKMNPDDSTKTISNNSLSVIDISSPSHPTVRQSLEAGFGAAGVVINPAGTLALVANTDEDTVSVFSISGGKLTPTAKLPLAAKSRPVSIYFLPGGTAALVVCQGASKLVRLSIDGTNVANANTDITPDVRGASLAIPIQNGRFAILNGTPNPPAGAAPPARGAPRVATASIIDLSSGQTVSSTDIGVGPEYIGLSPDGHYLEATIVNGSHDANTSPGFNDFGLIKVLSVNNSTIAPLAEAQTGHWCQGAVWSSDGRALLLECGQDKELEVFHFDGHALTRDMSATIKFDAYPAGIAGATSH